MSLEQKIEELTAAVVALTAKMSGAAPAATAEKAAAKAEKPVKAEKPATYEARFTKEEMQALMTDVRTKISMAKAKHIRDEFGKVEKLGELTDAKAIDTVADAATAALAAHAAESGDGL